MLEWEWEVSPLSFRKAYVCKGIIDRGAHSQVFKVGHRSTGNVFAAKICNDEGEGQLLASCGACEEVVKYVESYTEGGIEVIIMEYVENGDLFGYLSRGVVQEKRIKVIVKQLLRAVMCLHKLGVVHRDIKLENVLLTSGGDVKLVDFGTAVRIGQSRVPCLSKCCGSSHYIAPEILATKSGHAKRYGQEVDMWSLGVLTYVLLYSAYPFDLTPHTQARETGSYFFPSNPVRSPEAINFVSCLLQVTPSMRPTVPCALQHAWLN
eukprot:TRINITY_DN12146_c0_g1_i1.p1 TRINITY_DN12146_c0_g1~~TRINITY_DN12146_c0_g1_i1.p1  ORF type:complete len:264 (+),score=20.69 TRINITY_DN12146_c0_g1_i1:56-847(+)